MKQLEKLIIEATVLTEPEAEVERVMQVCNVSLLRRFLRGISGDDPAARIR